MEFERLEFPVAVEILARQAGVEVPVERNANPEKKKKQDNLYDQLDKAQQHFALQLRQHPSKERAVNYLKGRQLTGTTAKRFGIGYAPPGWKNLRDALAKTEKDEQQLIEAGLLIKREDHDGCYDRFRDRIIFPIRDNRGRAIAFGGRVLGDDKPKYLNSPESPVFHKGNELYGLYEARQASNRLSRFLIVEGYMDVVALAQHDINYAVATLGTSTSEAHLNKLFRMVPEVIFCFDGDDAGRKAASRALETALPILEDGRQIRFLFLPEGEDPDSLVHKEGNKNFTKRLDQAMTLTEYFFTSVSEGLDVDSLDGQARLSKLVLEKMHPMPRGVFYELMLKQLSEITGLSPQTLKQNAAQTPAATVIAPSHDYYTRGYENIPEPSDYGDYEDFSAAPAAPQHATPRRSRVTEPAEKATALLLHHPELASCVENIDVLRSIDSPGMLLLVELLELLTNHPQSNTAGVLAHFQGTHGEDATNTLKALAEREQITAPEDIQNYFLMSLALLQKHHQKEQLEQLIEQDKHTPLTSAEKQQMKALIEATSRK